MGHFINTFGDSQDSQTVVVLPTMAYDAIKYPENQKIKPNRGEIVFILLIFFLIFLLFCEILPKKTILRGN